MDYISDSITYEKIERSIELLEFILKQIYEDFEVNKDNSLEHRLIECNNKFMKKYKDENDIIQIDDDEEDENN